MLGQGSVPRTRRLCREAQSCSVAGDGKVASGRQEDIPPEQYVKSAPPRSSVRPARFASKSNRNPHRFRSHSATSQPRGDCVCWVFRKPHDSAAPVVRRVDLMTLGYLTAGLLDYFLAGLTGVGGGSLMTPLLVFLFRFSARGRGRYGSCKVCGNYQTGGVLVHHGKHKSVDWRIVGLFAAGVCPDRSERCLCCKKLRTRAGLNRIVTSFWGVALIGRTGTASAQYAGAVWQKSGCADSQSIKTADAADDCGGLFAGCAGDAVFGGSRRAGNCCGAGAVSTAADANVVETDLAFAIPPTAVAGLGHWRLGHVDFRFWGVCFSAVCPESGLEVCSAPRFPNASCDRCWRFCCR